MAAASGKEDERCQEEACAVQIQKALWAGQLVLPWREDLLWNITLTMQACVTSVYAASAY